MDRHYVTKKEQVISAISQFMRFQENIGELELHFRHKEVTINTINEKETTLKKAEQATNEYY